jgi:hypothetical protein
MPVRPKGISSRRVVSVLAVRSMNVARRADIFSSSGCAATAFRYRAGSSFHSSSESATFK